MMTFDEYYRREFRADIQQFMMSIPAGSRHHDNDESQFTIQYGRLTKDTRHLDVIAAEKRAYFAVALFFSVLVDEVCYTHFQWYYDKFRSLTRYPKFIGDCLGACRYHLHPREIFTAINYSRDVRNAETRPNIEVQSVFQGARGAMRKEVFDFFTHYMTEIDPTEFWGRCVYEFPEKEDQS